jgi:LmbE family N-acetylglucosaminyl deacetylase
VVLGEPLASGAAPPAGTLEVGDGERLVVVAPHPDDETLGAGGLVQRVLQRGGSVRIVLVTAGDGYVEAVVHETGQLRPPAADYIAYGRRRLGEARAAIRVLGGDLPRLQFLGFPDGGCEALLRAHWRRTQPEHSRTTKAVDPPYDDAAIEPNVLYDGADLRRELLRLLQEDRPTLLVLPDPLDRHPDHRAAGLFTLLALHDWLRPPATPLPGVPVPGAPRILAYLIHWPQWPPLPPAAAEADSPLHLPANFPARTRHELELTLTDEEIARKRQALACYDTQQREMPALLGAFVRRSEPFIEMSPPTLPQIKAMIEERLSRSTRARP